MKRSLICGVFAVFAATACGQKPKASGLAEFDAGGPYSLEAQHGALSVKITANQSLEKTATKDEGGWLVLAWATADAANGELRVSELGDSSSVFTLVMSPGASGVVLGSAHKIYTAGHVTGYASYVCGPQGMRCKTPLPELPRDLSYACGPQGARCRVEVPNVTATAVD